MNKKIVIGIMMAIVFVSGIVAGFVLFSEHNNTEIANPASVNCLDQGGTVSMVQTDQGEHGICTFNDGSQCEEWALFREECKKGDTKNYYSTCSLAEECIPLPSECHARSCINKAYENQFVKPEVCTMMYDESAAYNPTDCDCINDVCVNKNLK